MRKTKQRPKPTKARPMRHVPDLFLACWAFGHPWDLPKEAQNGDRPRTFLSGEFRVFECLRCTTTRPEVWGALSKLIYRTYHHPEGYSLGKIHLPPGVTKRQAARDEWYRRQRDAV
jgi:hypothetical protein